MPQTLLKKPIPNFVCIVLISVVGYMCIGYTIPRVDFAVLILVWTLLFLGYAQMIKMDFLDKRIGLGVLLALAIRLSLLFCIPALSDDFYRFIWDGRLSIDGINPFAVLPAAFVKTAGAATCGLDSTLFSLLNSQNYYTVYPPVLQGIFWASSWLFPTNEMGNIVLLRIFTIAAETGSIFLIISLLKKFNLPIKNVFIYALNPLVILELTGNLHGEAIMIFFILLFIYFLTREYVLCAALAFSLAICSKLLPIIFLPLLIKSLGIKKSLLFYSICAIACGILFTPFTDPVFLKNMGSSLTLYFQKFEFNASIFYLFRWIGFKSVGYDVVRVAGKYITGLSFLGIIGLFLINKSRGVKSLCRLMLFSLMIYFAFALVVHPWYLTTLVMLSVFTTYRFPVVWSALITLTYITYSSLPYKENINLVLLEYVILYSFLGYEIFRNSTRREINWKPI
jgi:alpha-1,6-mannosyltransferase